MGRYPGLRNLFNPTEQITMLQKIMRAMYVVFFLLSFLVLAVSSTTKLDLQPIERASVAVFGIVNAIVFSELAFEKKRKG